MARQKTTLNPWQEDVLNFHKALGLPTGCACTPRLPSPDRRELRATLIEEEAQELVDALRAGRFIDAVDGMCDLMVVVLGTAVECNLDLQKPWDEVHASNMAKQGGPRREDGKVLKPEGWQPPDLNGVLQTGRGRYT